MSAFNRPEARALHTALVAVAREQPEYARNPAALSAYAEGAEHAIEALHLKGHRDVSTLIAAYEVTGPGPAIHYAAQDWLARNWPSLHNAIATLRKELHG